MKNQLFPRAKSSKNKKESCATLSNSRRTIRVDAKLINRGPDEGLLVLQLIRAGGTLRRMEFSPKLEYREASDDGSLEELARLLCNARKLIDADDIDAAGNELDAMVRLIPDYCWPNGAEAGRWKPETPSALSGGAISLLVETHDDLVKLHPDEDRSDLPGGIDNRFHSHIPHNREVMQTVCETCQKELVYDPTQNTFLLLKDDDTSAPDDPETIHIFSPETDNCLYCGEAATVAVNPCADRIISNENKERVLSQKITALEELASELIGDGATPNVFFVSMAERGVIMLTTDGEAAHNFWGALPRNVETSLEDRHNGTVASTEPVEDGSKVMRTYDDFARFFPQTPDDPRDFVVRGHKAR